MGAKGANLTGLKQTAATRLQRGRDQYNPQQHPFVQMGFRRSEVRILSPRHQITREKSPAKSMRGHFRVHVLYHVLRGGLGLLYGRLQAACQQGEGLGALVGPHMAIDRHHVRREGVEARIPYRLTRWN